MTDRRDELLDRCYAYALDHGLTTLSLRPLAEAVGSSPRVLLFLFGSKDGLVRALLERARADELAHLGGGLPPGELPTGEPPASEQPTGKPPAGGAPAGDPPAGEPPPGEPPAGGLPAGGLAAAGLRVWDWLADPDRRGLLVLWTEAYARSLVEPTGPWADFARRTVSDWLDLLAAAQPPARRRTAAGAADRTAALAVLRGAMLDLLATGDTARTTAAVRTALLGGTGGA